MNYKFDGNKVFFTSDTHFYHANIINFCKRPFANVETMNEALIENNRSGTSEGFILIAL